MGIFDRNPMTYARALDVNIYVKRDFKPLEDRMRDIVTIEDQAANIMTAGKTNLAPVLPKPYVELGIQVANGAADFLEKDLAAALKDVKDEQLTAAFQDSNKKAVAALRDFAAWLTKERLPKATADFAIGPAKYQRMLAGTELVDLAPDKVLAIGLQRLKEEQDTFAAAAKIIDPKKKPVEVFKEIQNEHPKAEELVSDVAKDLDQIRQYVIDHHLVAIPSDVRASVAETPQFDRATSFASMDTPGPFERKATQAYYYVTPVEENWTDKQKNDWLTSFNYYTTDVVSIHEAYPGHYVQFLHLNASTATQIEKIFGSYAFIEGWAHYTEKMMLDEGFGSARRIRRPSRKCAPRNIAWRRPTKPLLRLCRLCVSIKMHTQGMSVADGAKFFHENCYYEEKPSMSEAMRGTFDPGYLNYTLGKLEILKLRDDYKAQEGKSFSLEKFHNEMLNHGMPPIRLLREMHAQGPIEMGRGVVDVSHGDSEVRLPADCHGLPAGALKAASLLEAPLTRRWLRPSTSFAVLILVRQQLRQQRLRMTRRPLDVAQFLVQYPRTLIDLVDLVGGFLQLLLHSLEDPAEFPKLRLHLRQASLQTSLELFWIASVRNPICRLLSNAASVVGPANITRNRAGPARPAQPVGSPPHKVLRWAKT